MIFCSTGPRTLSAYGQPHSGWSTPGFHPFLAGEYSYDKHREPSIVNPVLHPTNERWVAPFATSDGLTFVPVLKVAAVTAVGYVDVEPSTGSLVRGSLRGRQALLVSRDKYRSVTVADNYTTGFTKLDGDLAQPNDFIIVAPAGDFAMLPLLKLDSGDQFEEWRNWTSDGGRRMQSYTGNPFGDIKSTMYTELDFGKYISPLATGVMGTIQVFAATEKPTSPYIYVSRDSGEHVVQSAGLDRTREIHAGLTTPFAATFGYPKRLWVKVAPECVGRVTIMGWME